MAELSAFFCLIGMLGYLKGRELFKDGKTIAGYGYITITVVSCITLGILSKENAILLCLYLLIIEWILLPDFSKPKLFTTWKLLFLILPLVVLVAYVFLKALPFLDTPYPYREFTAIERLITQPRVIIDYINSILLPRPKTFGLFNYDYIPSRSLLEPLDTLYKTIAVMGIILIAVKIRKYAPIVSFGVLFYFSAHALESSILNLELYFEHRNYLALYGLLLSGYGVFHVCIQILNKRNLKKGVIALFIGNTLWILLIGSIALYESKLWKNPIYQLSVWAEEKPTDHRAQGYYGLILTKYGWFNEAEKAYQRGFQNAKDDLTLPLLWLELQCFSDEITPPSIDEIIERVPTSKYHHSTLMVIDSITSVLDQSSCESLNLNGLINITQELLKAPKYQYTSTQQQLNILLSKLYFHNNNIDSSAIHLENAFKIKPTLDILTSLVDRYFLLKNQKKFMFYLNETVSFCENNPVQCFSNQETIRNMKEKYKIFLNYEDAYNWDHKTISY